jgi:Cys-tRNA(Pro)/Cys-tRNA(Cys) deacylase
LGIGFVAMATGTPATKLLKSAGIKYTEHEYSHDPNSTSFGLEAAEKLGINPNRVFKTLIANVDETFAVAVVPVNQQVSLKSLSRALNAKRASMADPAQAARLTGYVVGGISPLGQKRLLATVIDESAKQFETILVSGGRRGFDIELSPNDLAEQLSALFAEIAS